MRECTRRQNRQELRLVPDIDSKEGSDISQPIRSLVRWRQTLIPGAGTAKGISWEVPIVFAAGRKKPRRPHRVIEVVIRSHYKQGVLSGRIAGNVVARVVVVMYALKCYDITVAIGERHGKRHPVDNLTVEIGRSNCKDGLDSVRGSQGLVVLEMAHDAFAAP